VPEGHDIFAPRAGAGAAGGAVGRLGKALLHTSLLLLVLGIALVFYLDRIVGTAVERGGSHALGVRTDVGGVQLGLLRGHVGLSDLEVANPEGFHGEHFLRLGSIRIEIPPAALREETVVIPSIALEDLELTLAGSRAGTNYGRILRNLESLGGGASQPAAEAPGGGRKFVVKELVVRNVNATLALDGFGSKLASTSIAVPEMRLTNLGEASGRGVPLAELIAQLTEVVVQNVVRQRPELATQLTSELRGQLETGAQRAREGLEQLGGMIKRGR
jgi:hypothetical protein